MKHPSHVGEGRWALTVQIGQGTFGDVFRATDAEGGPDVAIKLLSPAMSRHKKAVARFVREAQLLERIDHPGIVRLLDWDQMASRPWLAVELAEHGTAWDWSHEHGPMPARMATRTALQVCSAVGAAHASGVVHRDIKPSNVLFAARGVVKVCDFGIAHDSLAASTLTQPGTRMGSLGYMAPEQRADATRATVVSDVFSTAAVLFSLLTAFDPLDMARDLPPYRGRIDERLFKLIRAATDDAPGGRPQTVEALADGLHEALPDLPSVPPGVRFPGEDQVLLEAAATAIPTS